MYDFHWQVNNLRLLCLFFKELNIKGGSRFLKSKWAGEQAVREEFPDAIIVRPADTFGNGDRYIT